MAADSRISDCRGGGDSGNPEESRQLAHSGAKVVPAIRGGMFDAILM